MPLNNMKTWANGELVTAAQMNAEIRDSVNALTPGHQVLTTAQRTALAGAAIGTMVYDSTLGEFALWNGSAWVRPFRRMLASVERYTAFTVTGTKTNIFSNITFTASGLDYYTAEFFCYESVINTGATTQKGNLIGDLNYGVAATSVLEMFYRSHSGTSTTAFSQDPIRVSARFRPLDLVTALPIVGSVTVNMACRSQTVSSASLNAGTSDAYDTGGAPGRAAMFLQIWAEAGSRL
jgi:hypothetical protein